MCLLLCVLEVMWISRDGVSELVRGFRWVQLCWECRNVRQLSVVVRQDRFLYVATATLLNLAEDVSVQRKMRKKVGWSRLSSLLGSAALRAAISHFQIS